MRGGRRGGIHRDRPARRRSAADDGSRGGRWRNSGRAPDQRSAVLSRSSSSAAGRWAEGGALAPTLGGVEAVAEAFGGRHVSAGEFRGDVRLDAEAACRRGGRCGPTRTGWPRRGLLVAVEAFPWSAIAAIGIAIDLIRRAGATNAGLMIDVWHFFNSGANCRSAGRSAGSRCRRSPTQRRPAGARRFSDQCQGAAQTAGRRRSRCGRTDPGCPADRVHRALLRGGQYPRISCPAGDEAARQAADTATEVLFASRG